MRRANTKSKANERAKNYKCKYETNVMIAFGIFALMYTSVCVSDGHRCLYVDKWNAFYYKYKRILNEICE